MSVHTGVAFIRLSTEVHVAKALTDLVGGSSCPTSIEIHDVAKYPILKHKYNVVSLASGLFQSECSTGVHVLLDFFIY